MKMKDRLLKSVLKLAGGVFALTLAMGMAVQAKEVTVSTAKEFETAVEEGKNLEETLTVTIAAGSDITVERFVRVYSNTVINAEGAIIRNTDAEVALLVHDSDAEPPVNVTINGGTWEAGGNAFLDMSGAANVTIKNAVIHGSGDHLVRLTNSQNVTFEGCSMSGASVLIKGGSDNAVKSCTLDGSSDPNIPLLQVMASNTLVEGNTITNSANNGIRIENNAQNVSVINNKIQNSHSIGIESEGGGNHKIKDNELSNSGFMGIRVSGDQGSEISGNSLLGNAVSADFNGEGLVVDNASNGTVVSGNTVRDTSGRVDNVGNGIIVNRSENITVSDNTVSGSHNHGIQVSYQSKNVTVIGNKIFSSGRMGISVTRGAQADLKNNQISDSASRGITFDGSKEGVVSGSIENCTVSGSILGGVYIEGANVSMNGNTIANNCRIAENVAALTVKGSTVTAENNKIYQDAQDNAHGGITVTGRGTLTINNNIISNFALYGVYAPQGNTVSGNNNQVNIVGTEFPVNPAYAVYGGSIPMNTITVSEIGRTKAVASGNYSEAGSGAVIGGARREGVLDGTGAFSVEYPDTDPANVILYTQDSFGNVICVQAPVNYSLKDAGVADPDDNIPDSGNREQVEEFVKRIYRVALGREAEEAGLKDWTDRLVTGRAKGAEVAQGVVFSEEFTNKNLNDEQFVRTLYRAMFDREADQGGLEGWLRDLHNGASREYVYHGFAEGDEFSNLCKQFNIQQGTVTLGQPRDQNIKLTEFVSRVYYIALNRSSLDEAGINDWCGRILSGKSSPADVVWGIVFSAEFKNRELDDSAFVTTMYKTYFDRDAALDPAGFNDWFGRLQRGESRETVVNGFSNSEEFDNLVRSFGL